MKTLSYGVISLLLISGCNNDSIKPQAIKTPSAHPSPAASTDLVSDNYFADQDNWGDARQFIDYSGQILLKDDARVDDYYKKNLPNFSQNYVLWRVTHDGSCWIQAAAIVIINELIALDSDAFLKAIDRWKTLAQKNSQHYDSFRKFEENGTLKKFFDLIEIIGRKANLKQALSMFNYTKVKDLLNYGLRLFINPSQPEIDLCAWENIEDAQALAATLSIPCAGFSGPLEGVVPSARFVGTIFSRHMKSRYENFDYWNNKLINIERTNEPLNYRLKKYHDTVEQIIEKEKKNLPKLLYFRSRNVYMDIAALKTYSDKINATKIP